MKQFQLPKQISKKTLSKVGRAGAVLAATALSLGSTTTGAAEAGSFVANAPSLEPVAVAAADTDPIVERRIVHVAAPAPQPVATQQVASSGGGGSCTLDVIKQRESGGDYRAQNSTSTASGAYQVLNGTWGGYGGYKRAGDAPKGVQDKFAQSLYAKHGSAPWVVC